MPASWPGCCSASSSSRCIRPRRRNERSSSNTWPSITIKYGIALRQGHQLIAQLRRHGVICFIEDGSGGEVSNGTLETVARQPLVASRSGPSAATLPTVRYSGGRVASGIHSPGSPGESGKGVLRRCRHRLDTGSDVLCADRYAGAVHQKNRSCGNTAAGAGEAQEWQEAGRLRVCKEGNRLLKGLLIGAAKSIISGESPLCRALSRFASARSSS